MSHRIQQLLLLLISLGLWSSPLAAQLLFNEPFGTDIQDWDNTGQWSWDANGKADDLAIVGWEGRSRLRSFSEGGAALFASTDSDGQLASPTISVPNSGRLYVHFYQYFRSQGGRGNLQILDAAGNVIFSQVVTAGITADLESSAGNYQIIDVSDVILQGVTDLRIQFDVDGPVEFWLLDDVRVQTTRPAWQTFPIYFGVDMADNGVPFTVDATAMPWAPFELVVDYTDGITSGRRDSIQRLFPIVEVQSCVCDRLEVWKMRGGRFFDPVTGQPLGDPGDILERVLGQGSNNDTGGIDDIELNFYTYDEIESNPPNPGTPLPSGTLAQRPLAPAGAIKVAILDTGLDYDHPDLQPYLYRNNDGPANATDDDANCLTDDLLGWNYVNDNNNPVDDHGHGTHVAGIVAQTVAGCTDCTVQLIPYKTHNNIGVGTLFATACATLQASVMDRVDVINASWGFYGTGSDILRRAIDTAEIYGAVVVAAAGNDSLNLVADAQFPATYAGTNVFGVGAFTTTPGGGFDRAAYSNYNNQFVDLFSTGTDVTSTLPGGGTGLKTGTSMSTPMVAAAAALKICRGDAPNASAVLATVFDDADKYPNQLGTFVRGGALLDTTGLCADRPPVITGTVGDLTVRPVSADRPGSVVVAAPAPGLPIRIDVRTLSGEEIRPPVDGRIAADGTITFALGTEEPGTYILIVTYAGRRELIRYRLPE